MYYFCEDIGGLHCVADFVNKYMRKCALDEKCVRQFQNLSPSG